MSKNLSDLNEFLFAQLERLSNAELEGDKLSEEIQRTETICKVSKQIIDGANVVLDAIKLKNDAMDATLKLPQMLE